MKSPILAALLLLAAAPSFAASDAAFDQGVDVSALAAQAKESAKKDKTVVSAQSMNGTRYDMDCVRITFSATDAPKSDRVWLRSQEWVTECQQTGDPRHGGSQQCWDRPGMSWTEGVQITLQRPATLPWEHDSFRVCLQGPWLYTDALQTAFDYKNVSSSRDAGDIVLQAGRKIAQDPDQNGVLASLDARLKLSFADKWASYYAGEQIALKIELKKVVKFWPDATILEKEVTLPVSAAYGVDLNAFVSAMASKPEAGKEYYVKYSIKRIGVVSRPSYTKTLETGKVTYAPGLDLAAR